MAAQAVEQVVEQGQSLSNILPPLQQKVSDKEKHSSEVAVCVLRTLSQLDWLINKLMARPMTWQTADRALPDYGWFVSTALYPHSTSCCAG